MAAPWLKTLWDAYQGGTPAEQAAWLATYPWFQPPTNIHQFMAVRAPCCNRRRAADDVLDLRGVADTVTRGRSLDWACDGCWTLLVREADNNWTRSRLFRALGAPAATVKELRARELAEERIAALPRGKKFKRDDMRAQARSDLPNGTRDVPGTDHPTRGGT